MSTGNGSRPWMTVAVAACAVVLGSAACKPKIAPGDTKAAAQRAAASSAASVAGLTQSLQSPGKLITVHFPSDFSSEAPNASVLALSREVSDGNTEMLTFISVAEPAAKDFDAFTRTALLAEKKRPAEWEYKEISRANVPCNGAPGLNVLATWKPNGELPLHRRWWCAFLRDGHGYAFSYNVPVDLAAKDEPLLRSIIDATTFAKP